MLRGILSTMWKIVFPVICLGFIGFTFGKSTSVNDTVSSADSHRQGKCE